MNKLITWFRSLPWREAAKAAAKVLLPAALGAGGAILAGCGSLAPAGKENRIGVYAFGIPGVAVVTSPAQVADNRGDDEAKPVQVNAATLKP